MELVYGDLLDPRSDRPLVAKRIDHGRHSVAVHHFAWLLNRSCAGRYGAPVNKINIGNVHIERAAGGLTTFEGSHHGNDGVAETDRHVRGFPVWQVVPIQQRSVERVLQKRVQLVSVCGRENRDSWKASGYRVNCHTSADVLLHQ